VFCILFKAKIIIAYVLQNGLRPEIVNEAGDFSVVRVRRPLADIIATNCDLIRDAVHGLIETYCHAFRVDFQLNSRAELPTSELFCLNPELTVFMAYINFFSTVYCCIYSCNVLHIMTLTIFERNCSGTNSLFALLLGLKRIGVNYIKWKKNQT
jgi:hypothetical protein